VKTDQIIGNNIRITGMDVHHITNVMRFNTGDNILVCTDELKTYFVKIAFFGKNEVMVEVVKEIEEDVELPVKVTIAQGITKGDKFDLVVQKATECGAHYFVPVEMKRCVAKIEPKKSYKKIERWQKIALEASRQSHRQVVPNIMDPVGLKELIKSTSEYDVCLFAYEAHGNDEKKALATELKKMEKGSSVLILIGPEGGIDDTEVVALKNAGFVPIGLGPRILRCETAPIYVMSAISYALEIEV